MQVFTSFFALEAALKLMALSKEYFSSGWNIFDLIIVIASLIDLSVESVNGISVLRGMRLVRTSLTGEMATDHSQTPRAYQLDFTSLESRVRS